MSARRRELLDAGWALVQQDVAGAEAPDWDDSGWRRVDLPHDWSIEGPFREDHPSGGGGGYVPGGVGWYRKTFTLPEEDVDRMVSVEFDGVYKNCDVWINGHHLGFHPYGYTSFFHELTPFVSTGPMGNVLAVRVDNSEQPDARWYSGSGSYRHVWLLVTDRLHTAHWGTHVTTPTVSAELATVSVRTRIADESPETHECAVRATLIDRDGNEIAAADRRHAILAGQEHEAVLFLRVFNPRLWSIDDHYLYPLRSEILDKDRVVDAYDTPLGIRDVVFDADRGFLLNGHRAKINGVCLHHDAGCVGAAVPERVLERRLERLKEMGCNGIRTSHYPPAPELLDMCDRLGLVVMDEALDEWRQGHDCTAGDPARMALAVDRDTIAADGRDVVHVTVRVLDASGHLVPNAGNDITFEIEGQGRLIGVDNGDPASHEPFRVDRRRAFHGQCLAMVQASGEPGPIRIAATSAGLRVDSVAVEAIRE